MAVKICLLIFGLIWLAASQPVYPGAYYEMPGVVYETGPTRGSFYGYGGTPSSYGLGMSSSPVYSSSYAGTPSSYGLGVNANSVYPSAGLGVGSTSVSISGSPGLSGFLGVI